MPNLKRYKQMNKIEKMKASKEAKKAKMKAQTITVDANWQILRSDPLNWEIQYKGKFQGYYGTIGGALTALPAKMLSEEARGSLSDVLRTTDGIRATIEKAIP